MKIKNIKVDGLPKSERVVMLIHSEAKLFVRKERGFEYAPPTSLVHRKKPIFYSYDDMYDYNYYIELPDSLSDYKGGLCTRNTKIYT